MVAQTRGSASGANHVGACRDRAANLFLFQRQKKPAELSPLPTFSSGGSWSTSRTGTPSTRRWRGDKPVVVVDTNILVYAADADSWHVKSRNWIEERRDRPEAWYVTWPILYEFMRDTRVMRKPWSATRAWAFV